MKRLTLLLFCIVIMGMQIVNAQVRRISGNVTSSADNQPIPGVSVIVKGTATGTVTNPDGTFRLDVPQSATTLVFSFVGMKSIELPISGPTVNAVLEPDVIGIDEVIAVAYGTAK